MAAGRLHGILQEPADLGHRHLRRGSIGPAGLQVQPRLVSASSGFTVVSTVLWGRLYCGRICAFGALTQLMDAVVPAKLRVEVPLAIERRATLDQVRAARRASSSTYVATHDVAVYPLRGAVLDVRPLRHDRRCGSALGVLLLATVFVRNLYCRFLCPVGAMLGIISNLTVFRIKRWSECNTCKICEKTCEWGAIQRSENHRDRVRALRRLRAALPRPAEVPALDHPAAEGRQAVRVVVNRPTLPVRTRATGSECSPAPSAGSRESRGTSGTNSQASHRHNTDSARPSRPSHAENQP